MNNPPRRGLATVAAIILLGLAGLAMAALAALVHFDAQRTRLHRTDAQLRQMLLIGAAAARSSGPAEQAIALPKSLADEGASLTLRRQGPQATIEATLAGRRLQQTLRLSPNAQQILEARLDDRVPLGK